MYLIAAFFLKVVFKALIPEALATQYLAGAVLLGVALATVVGVLTEVPIMLIVVRISNNTGY